MILRHTQVWEPLIYSNFSAVPFLKEAVGFSVFFWTMLCCEWRGQNMKKDLFFSSGSVSSYSLYEELRTHTLVSSRTLLCMGYLVDFNILMYIRKEKLCRYEWEILLSSARSYPLVHITTLMRMPSGWPGQMRSVFRVSWGWNFSLERHWELFPCDWCRIFSPKAAQSGSWERERVQSRNTTSSAEREYMWVPPLWY